MKAVKGSVGTTLALDSLDQKRKHPKIEMARKDSSPFLACSINLILYLSKHLLHNGSPYSDFS